MNYNSDSKINRMKDEEEEDDWNPEIKKKDSILNKVVVNFTNQAIKKKNLVEEELEDAIFRDLQKNSNEQDASNNPEHLDDSYDNEDNLMFDKAQIKENMKSYMKGENLYDPLIDFKEEEWVKQKLKKDQFSSIVLSCPFCFTQVCYDCQKHEVYENQFRALFARNCKVNCTKTINPLVSNKQTNKQATSHIMNAEKLEELKEKCRNYFSVECCVCSTEVGVYEADEKIYYFFHVIPGLG